MLSSLSPSSQTSKDNYSKGVLRTSSDRDDRRVFGGLKFSIPEFFGV